MTKKFFNFTRGSRFWAFFDKKWVIFAVPIVAVLLYGILTFATMAGPSIWFDEAFSAYIVRYNWWEIAQYTAVDVHPPAYYWVLSAWTHLFGSSEIAFRSLSAFFGGAVVVLGYLLSKKLFGQRAAVLTALLLALSPMLIKFGQEARMYTMVAAIVFAATLILVYALKSNKRSPWVWYGVLLALGMYTHYFAALAWLALWVWRLVALRIEGKRGKKLFAAFFTKNWIIAHAVALVLFAPWMVAMISQFVTNQQGFWIGPVGASTPVNYLGSTFFYLEGGQVLGWYALWLFALIAIVSTLSVRAYKKLKKGDKAAFLLPFFMAVVPPALLFLSSMPPLKSAFVERYLVPSITFLSLFIAVAIAARLPQLKRWMQIGLVAIFVATSIFGISKVYYYGNYNKNSHVSIQTRQLIEAIREQAKPGEPIIADSPWIYYEASFYDNSTNPIYFLESTTENYKYGSLEMLKHEKKSKILNLDDFLKQHPVVWYFGNTGSTEITPPKSEYNLVPLQRLKAVDPIDHKADYNAVQLRVSAE